MLLTSSLFFFFLSSSATASTLIGWFYVPKKEMVSQVETCDRGMRTCTPPPVFLDEFSVPFFEGDSDESDIESDIEVETLDLKEKEKEKEKENVTLPFHIPTDPVSADLIFSSALMTLDPMDFFNHNQQQMDPQIGLGDYFGLMKSIHAALQVDDITEMLGNLLFGEGDGEELNDVESCSSDDDKVDTASTTVVINEPIEAGDEDYELLDN